MSFVAIYFIVGFVIVAACVSYISFIQSVGRRVRKAWLHVYETYQRRSDKIPLLIEIIRRNAKEYESLLKELISARSATQGISFPSMEKTNTERVLGEVLERVIETANQQENVLRDKQFIKVRDELLQWDEHLALQISAYHKSLMIYRVFALGMRPSGYTEYSI